MTSIRSSSPRRVPAVLAAVALGCSAYGLFQAFQTPTRGTTMSVLQVPSDRPRITAAEILARFPKAGHEEYMRRAIANSRKAGVEFKTGGAFGAVVVARDGAVLADGLNHVVAQNDPTWHGEMHAIRQACALLKKPKLDGCILYSSSEPCPMCLAAAYWAGVDGVVFGAKVEDSKEYGNFDDAFIYEQFAAAPADRLISQQSLLRDEAVKVWKEYRDRADKVDYQGASRSDAARTARRPAEKRPR